MSRRNRYADRSSIGRSDVAAYYHGEPGGDRHARRLNGAIDFQEVLREWCLRNGFTLKIRNDGHHWILQGVFLAEWWPSSAKLVFNKRWDRGVHCHDVEQLATIVSKRLESQRQGGH